MANKKLTLTLPLLYKTAKEFCDLVSGQPLPELFGITDGKAVGTFVEHRLKNYLIERYDLETGNSASGIDLPAPSINTDIKVTYIKQPQSSCPYKSAKQKIFGLGYNLLVLVYDKIDDPVSKTSHLKFLNCTFVNKERTADFTTTKRLIEMKKDGASKEDIIAYFIDRNLPCDEIECDKIAEEVLKKEIIQGYLTISNALQWRLQYGKVIALSNSIEGVLNYDIGKN